MGEGAESYGLFIEEFDTADLQKAQSLLDICA
jgi:hypothetical protein